MTQENADTFPILICVETVGLVKRGQHVVNGNVPLHILFHIWSVFIRDIGFWPIEVLREHVGMGHDEDEEQLEAQNP